LPAYNEERALPQVLERFQRVVGGAATRYAVVVDDGSTDGPRGHRGMEPAVAARYAEARGEPGLGETIRMRSSCGAEADPEDVVVTMDADNTHPVD